MAGVCGKSRGAVRGEVRLSVIPLIGVAWIVDNGNLVDQAFRMLRKSSGGRACLGGTPEADTRVKKGAAQRLGGWKLPSRPLLFLRASQAPGEPLHRRNGIVLVSEAE